jgi:capsular exopolysaccharide synthesis family protein
VTPFETATEPGLRDYLRVLRRRKSAIILSVAVVLGVSLIASYLQTPLYAATAKLLLQPRTTQSIFSSNSQVNADPTRSVRTEIEVIRTEPVQNLVRRKIGNAPRVEVSPVGQTDLVTIRAQGTDAKRTAVVANAYATSYVDFRRKQAVDDLSAAAEELQTKITDIQQQIDSLGTTLANAPACTDPKTTLEACTQRTNVEQAAAQRRTTLVSQLGLFQQRLDQLQVDTALASGGAELVTPASTPSSPFQPAPRRSALLAIVLGLLFGMGLAFMVEYLDDSIKGKDDFERAVPGMTVLGLVPLVADWKDKDRSRLVSLSDSTSSAAEAYRILRTSIQFLGLDRPVRVVQVTSPNAQDGKTTTLANLAVAFAASGLRTVAVDCDLRRPRLHEFFGLKNDDGFTSVLLGNVALSKALQPVPNQERLLLLASGPLPPNPSELLSSSRTAQLLRNLAEQADIVLVDSPPTLPVTDALVLSQRVDSTVIVTTGGTTTQKAAARAVEMLRQVNAPIIGAVLNGISDETGYANYSYRYYASEVGSRDSGRGPDEQVRTTSGSRHRRPAKRPV